MAGDSKLLVVVAIDKDKGSSQHAVKWAVNNLLKKGGQTLTFLHVSQTIASSSSSSSTPIVSSGSPTVLSNNGEDLSKVTKEFFLPFRCFCTRKNIQCNEVIVNEADTAKAIINYVTNLTAEILVLGASTNTFARRFRGTDIPSAVSKGAPEFCTVYVAGKGRLSSVRNASSPVPTMCPTRNQMQNQARHISESTDTPTMPNKSSRFSDKPSIPRRLNEDMEFKSPFTRVRPLGSRSYGEISTPETDISFVSSGRPSTERMFPSPYDSFDSASDCRLSNSSDCSIGSLSGAKSIDTVSSFGFSSSSSLDSGRMSGSPQSTDDVQAEMRRLKLELKQTMDMYSTACKEALIAKQMAMDLHRWKFEEQKKLEEARLGEEAALAVAENEKAKCRAAMEAAEASHRIAELEAQKRKNVERKAIKEAEHTREALNALSKADLKYRRYKIEEIEEATESFSVARKIGEGGYGPVYKCYLDHTPVAVKVLRPDAAQGRSQFQQEVEILSCIRHPNLVLLLGACPEFGCLVYEYMSNGSLEDRLFCHRNSPVLPWQLRFRISAEIVTGLLFLHQAKPEPLVHRDLKPGNVLLDRNYVSKISDVGLARLVPPTVADQVTQYRMTSTAGTFCYIDPEYQQTGMLGIKSDIYSLGIMLLQIITARPPMGLTHHVGRAIERGTFAEMLDPAVTDWPVEEALSFAKLALQCAEMRKKDRPDLGKVILPELNRLRMLAERNMPSFMLGCSPGASPNHSYVSSTQEVLSDYELLPSGNGSDSPKSH